MNSSQIGGKSKSYSKTSKTSKTSSSPKSKKGGNFIGTVGDLVAPSGWETFATTAGLFALDRADAALRRGKKTKSSAKKGGMRSEGETLPSSKTDAPPYRKNSNLLLNSKGVSSTKTNAERQEALNKILKAKENNKKGKNNQKKNK